MGYVRFYLEKGPNRWVREQFKKALLDAGRVGEWRAADSADRLRDKTFLDKIGPERGSRPDSAAMTARNREFERKRLAASTPRQTPGGARFVNGVLVTDADLAEAGAE